MSTNYNEIATQKALIAKDRIASCLEAKKIPISEIENELNVSKGYFSRLKNTPNRLPDINILCKLIEYLGMDYNSFFYSPLSYELADVDVTSKSVHTFIMQLYHKTISEEVRWSKRINMAHTASVIYSKGLREGLYGDEYTYTPDPDGIRNYEEKSKYKETKEYFECCLLDKENVSFYKIEDQSSDSYISYYEICINNKLIYATIGNLGTKSKYSITNNEIVNQHLDSLYFILNHPEDGRSDNLYTTETLNIINKYIKEDT